MTAGAFVHRWSTYRFDSMTREAKRMSCIGRYCCDGHLHFHGARLDMMAVAACWPLIRRWFQVRRMGKIETEIGRHAGLRKLEHRRLRWRSMANSAVNCRTLQRLRREVMATLTCRMPGKFRDIGPGAGHRMTAAARDGFMF